MASLAAASTNLATTSGITASAEMEAASVVIPSLPLMSDTEDAMVVEESSELDDPETLDLSSHGLTKLSRAAPGYELTTMTLLLDNNSLQRLDNIHTYQCLEKLSTCNNELIRMSQVCKLNHLKILNLSNNNIEFMDGLKELKLLSWLGLANNKIKTIQQLNQCVHLEHLDLSGNFIQHLNDLSFLKNLKVLLLHRNNLETLKGCDRFFPTGLTTLTLNGNDLTDLTDVSFLSGLSTLEQLTLADNPCILQPEDESKQFDYRPYVINWCLGLRVLDGLMVGAKESLKAEWMYSQSKGRSYLVGQHDDLLAYLLSVCPLHPGEDWEEDKKLNLILSKVQEHQQSLREPGSGTMSPRCNTLPRATASPAMRYNQSRKSSAASSASTTPTATPLAPRRSSFNQMGTPQRINSIRRSSLSRASPSPVRRRNLTPGRISGVPKPAPPPAAYALALPRSLYGDDINGNTSNMMMTQSMDPAHLAARLDNNATPTVLQTQQREFNTHIQHGGQDLMTASLDPSLLSGLEALQMKGLPEAWSKDAISSTAAVTSGITPTGSSSSTNNMSRPNSLFGQHHHQPHHIGAPESQDLKDLYLQDLSDGELSGSLMYTRLQTRLNPVPESLNSPDSAAPGSASGIGRPPAKDDPIRVYNRELAVSSSTVSTTSSSSIRQTTSAMMPNHAAKTKEDSNQDTNGYSSSSEDRDIERRTTTSSNNHVLQPLSKKNVNKQLTTTSGKENNKPSIISSGAKHHQGAKSTLSNSGGGGGGTTTTSSTALTNSNLQPPRNFGSSSKPKATPTKIVETRPVNVPLNKNLNSIKKQGGGLPLANSSNRSSPEADRKHRPIKSDTSRLSRNVSKEVKTEEEEESSHSEASIEHKQRDRVRRTRKARATSSAGARKESEIKKYAPEKYSDVEISTNRKSSRPASSASSRPRANTINTPTNVNKKLRPESASAASTTSKSPRSNVAAMTVQKNWRGHMAKEKDAERVNQLKEEVRGLRHDEHIKHLTKELASAKQALERERKLRVLQMDAIKVLWKEVQLMDETRNPSDVEVTRPSGRAGSKISSRSSEHSIAKLMETLQTVTPTSSTTVKTAEDVDVNNVDVLCPVSTPTTSTTNLMAQSMPASVLSGQLEQVQAVEALSKTCNSLQSQVVQLQSSLAGVMHFMSAFQQPPATLIEQQPQPSIRGRHSSNDASVASESAAAGLSYSYFTPIQMTQSVGPMSLPIQPATAAAVASMTSRPTLTLNKTLSEVMDSQGMAMSRSCDCLAQSELSSVLTPRNEQMPPNPESQFLHFKRVDISLETSDSEATSSAAAGKNLSKQASASMRLAVAATSSTSATSEPLTTASSSNQQERQSRLMQQQQDDYNESQRDRSKSPRPQTLPGLKMSTSTKTSASSEDRMKPTSPLAPQPVKAYAQNLVEGLFTNTINFSQAISDDEAALVNPKQQIVQGVQDECVPIEEDDDDRANEETDISLSLATEDQPDPIIKPLEAVVKSPISSHVETDSLDENSEHAGQH